MTEAHPDTSACDALALENIKLAAALRLAEGREVGQESLRAWERLEAERDQLREELRTTKLLLAMHRDGGTVSQS